MLIESPANPRVKAALRLRERRPREWSRRTLVDGGREALRALDGGVELQTAFVCRDRLATAEARAAVARLDAALPAGSELLELSERAFDRLAYGDRADGVVLMVVAPPTALSDLVLPADGADPLVVVTEDVEKPGNLGAILRSADAVGASAMIAVGGTDLFNPNVIRASVGAVFSVPVAAGDVGEVAAWLREHGLRIVASRVDAERLHVDTDLRGPLALVLGSEAAGLSDAWRTPDIEALRLPMAGAGDSLNVSAAAAVLLYEAWRQRRPPAGSAQSG